MTNGETPRVIPARTSTFERLAHMPSAQEMLRSEHETTLFRYLPVIDEDGLPVVEQDLPFTAADSGEIRQAALPAEEAKPGNDARWMSAEEVAAMIQQEEYAAEQEAMAEFQYGTSTEKSGEKRELEVRYKSPEASIDLKVTEGVSGDRIDRILGAFTGIAGQSAPVAAPRIAPAHEPYYLGSTPMPAPASIPAITAYPETTYAEDVYPLVDDVDYDPSVEQQQPHTIETFFDTTSEAQRRTHESKERAPRPKSKHRARLAALAILASGPLWFDSAGDTTFEALRQGINGEIISVTDAIAAFAGQEINKEDK